MIIRLAQGMLLASVAALAVTGCGAKPMESGVVATATPAVQEPKQQAASAPADLQSKIKVYFSDDDESKMIEKEVTISYRKDADKYAAALEALKNSDDAKAVSLFSDVTFRNVEFEAAKGELRMDLVFGPHAQLGSPGEDLFLQALKKTVFQFAEVKALYVLKDGKQAESLMGHMDLPYPIMRSN